MTSTQTVSPHELAEALRICIDRMPRVGIQPDNRFYVILEVVGDINNAVNIFDEANASLDAKEWFITKMREAELAKPKVKYKGGFDNIVQVMREVLKPWKYSDSSPYVRKARELKMKDTKYQIKIRKKATLVIG